MKIQYTFVLLLLLANCSNNESPVDAGLRDQVFHFGNGPEPQGIDPHIVTGVPENHLLTALCEGLTINNPKGGPNLPGVAKSWEISDDGKNYLFNIHETCDLNIS